MKLGRTVTTGAVAATLLMTGATAAFADNPEGADDSTTDTSPVLDVAPEPATRADTDHSHDASPIDPIAAPAPEAPTASEAEATVETRAVVPVMPSSSDAEPTADTPVESPAPSNGTTEPAPAAPTPTDAAQPSARVATQEDPEANPIPENGMHWHDGGQAGIPCDYWHFSDPTEGGSGKDWSGWSGSPQLHILQHTLIDADGNTRLVYDRDIAGSWYHAWGNNGESPTFVTLDPDGIHWSHTAAQQTVLVSGFRGGNDAATRAADAEALLARAGIDFAYPEWMTIEPQHEGQSDEDYANYLENMTEYRANHVAYAAYTATQFAVWYFSTGADVMSLFFDIDDAGNVALSAKAENLLTGWGDDTDWETIDWDAPATVEKGSWQNSSQSDRRAVLETAAWLIEQALNETNVQPQPGFVPGGYITNADGSTDYGFTASLTAGNGDLGVELRMADGSTMPAGVLLVDAQGKEITTIAPGQMVYIRVPAGLDVASMEQFQLWGSAQGTEKGTPDYYTGNADLANDSWDEETGEIILADRQRWLIGLGDLDRPTTIWNWIGIDFGAQLPFVPDEGTDGGEAPGNGGGSEGEQEISPVPVEPYDPITAPAPGTDPTNLGDTAEAGGSPLTAPGSDPAASTPAAASTSHLAVTGSDVTAIAALAGLVMLAGTGLVIVGRRRAHHAAQD